MVFKIGVENKGPYRKSHKHMDCELGRAWPRCPGLGLESKPREVWLLLGCEALPVPSFSLKLSSQGKGYFPLTSKCLDTEGCLSERINSVLSHGPESHVPQEDPLEAGEPSVMTIPLTRWVWVP